MVEGIPSFSGCRIHDDEIDCASSLITDPKAVIITDPVGSRAQVLDHFPEPWRLESRRAIIVWATRLGYTKASQSGKTYKQADMGDSFGHLKSPSIRF
jgi:hypothetical protein